MLVTSAIEREPAITEEMEKLLRLPKLSKTDSE
jgi:hypothetical protein